MNTTGTTQFIQFQNQYATTGLLGIQQFIDEHKFWADLENVFEQGALLTIYQGYKLPNLPIGTQPQLRSMRTVQFDVEEVEKLLNTDHDLATEVETAENVEQLD